MITITTGNRAAALSRKCLQLPHILTGVRSGGFQTRPFPRFVTIFSSSFSSALIYRIYNFRHEHKHIFP
jgi:hypothetical protein